MTTRIFQNVTCAICGTESEREGIASTSEFDFQDLDLRPPPLRRYTIDTWVHRCPSCGYCDGDTAIDRNIVSEFIKTDTYKAQLTSGSFPTLANSFLCASLISEETVNPVRAGWTALYAAWSCDDGEHFEAAEICRKRAASFFQIARETGIKLMKNPREEEIFLADIMRRAREFISALKICDEGLSKNPTKEFQTFLIFEKTLIEKKDSGSYTVGHARLYEPSEL